MAFYYFDQLRGMLVRNSLMKRRGWKIYLRETLIPVALAGVLVLIRLAVTSDLQPAVADFPVYNITRTEFILKGKGPIFAGPKVADVSVVMNKVIGLLNVTSSFRYEIHNDITSTKMNQEFQKQPNFAQTGVQFLMTNDSKSGQVFLNGYVLRLPYREVKHVTAGCSNVDTMGSCNNATGLSSSCPGNQALTSGLIQLQYAVETALIQTFVDPQFLPPQLEVQMMSVPEYVPSNSHLQVLLAIGMVIALAPLSYHISLTLSGEKERKNIVILKIAGLRYTIYWFTWFAVYTVIVAVIAMLCTVIMALSHFLSGDGLGFYIIFVFCYSTSLINLSFITTAFFKNAQAAGVVTSVLSVLLCLPYLAVCFTRSIPSKPGSQPVSTIPFGGQVVLSLLSPVAFALGIDQSVYLKETGLIGLSSDVGQFSETAAVVMLVLDTVLYGLIAAYLNNIIPGGHGVHRKPWFFLLPSYWCQGQKCFKDTNCIPGDITFGAHVEPVPEKVGGAKAIRIRELTKWFRKGKNRHFSAVNGIDLDIYEGQVTCILGHSGAGKSTLLSMLTGTCRPTSGIAYFYDLNISSENDHEELSKMIGYCPQYDVTVPELTVEEHLRLCALVRGSQEESIHEQSKRCMQSVGIASQKKTLGKDLNGFQKRKLSVAMALMGNPRVLLLDEPTLGLDHVSKQHLWNLLHSVKENRVVVMTTRLVEEADIMADRTIVLSKGNIRCVGSSHFLKRTFGVGYHLNLELQPSTKCETVLRAVRMHVRGANIEHYNDDKLTIMLPRQQANRFGGLFSRLEMKEKGAADLGIKSYTICRTTLEEAFDKLAEDEEAGNVFIGHLFPSVLDDVFDDPVNENELPRRTPSKVHSLHENSRNPMKAETTRHWSFIRERVQSRELLGAEQRWASQYPDLVPFHRSESESNGKEKSTSSNSIIKRMSSVWSKDKHKSTSSVDTENTALNGQSFLDRLRMKSSKYEQSSDKKASKTKAVAVGELKKSNTSTSLDSMASVYQLGEVDTDPSGLTYLRPQRTSVSNFTDFKRTMSMQANLSSLASLSEDSSIINPLSKLHILDAHDSRRNLSERSSSSRSVHSPFASREDLSLQQIDTNFDDVFVKVPEPDLEETLANVRSKEEGPSLSWDRFTALFKLRLLLTVRYKHALLFRIVFPFLLVLLAITLSYASIGWDNNQLRTFERIQLNNALQLVYRNLSGFAIDSLLEQFAQKINSSNLISLDDSNLSGDDLVSSLDILDANGSAFKMHYNYECGAALPQLTSFILQSKMSLSQASVTTTTSSTTSSTANTTGNTTYYNRTVLGQFLSAYLEPWPEAALDDPTVTTALVPILFMSIALAFTPIGYMIDIIRDRRKGIRTFLRASGVSQRIYWGAIFSVNFLEFFIPACALYIACALSPTNLFDEAGSDLALFLLILMYLPVAILWMQAVSFAFDSAKSAVTVVCVLIVLFAIGPYFVVFFLDTSGTDRAAKIIHYIFTICFPPYICFGGMHFIVQAESTYRETQSTSDFSVPFSVYFEPGYCFIACLIMLAIDIIVFPFVIVLLDKHSHGTLSVPAWAGGERSRDWKPRRRVSVLAHSDPGVEAEMRQLNDSQSKENLAPVVINRLTKVFKIRDNRIAAVQDFCLSLKNGEVVGLLGPDGAGKTTILRTLVGEWRPTRGTVKIENRISHSERRKLGIKVGYCPQHEPLWGCLTMEQHIALYGKIRGLRDCDTAAISEIMCNEMGIGIHRTEKVSTLSEGVLRKMMFAISMLGKPSLLLLDEPSKNMDPKAKQHFWETVKSVTKMKTSCAIVATHCMEEAMSLCSRVAIMVNGKMKCLGSPERLQEKYGRRYVLEVKLLPSTYETAEERMKMLTLLLHEVFPDLRLVESFRERAVFQLPSSSADFSLANAFETLETLKRSLDLEDYTFSQLTLQQVYLDFARYQTDTSASEEDIDAGNALPQYPPSKIRVSDPRITLNLAAGTARVSSFHRSDSSDSDRSTPEVTSACSEQGTSIGADSAAREAVPDTVGGEDVASTQDSAELVPSQTTGGGEDVASTQDSAELVPSQTTVVVNGVDNAAFDGHNEL